MKKVKIFLTIISFGVLFTSCDSRTAQDLEGGIVTNPTYTANVKPILDAKCVTCHSQNGQGNFPNLDTYQNVVDYQTDNNVNGNGYSSGGQGAPSLLCSIQSSPCTSDRMPKSDAPLSSSTITTIQNWINNNYPQ